MRLERSNSTSIYCQGREDGQVDVGNRIRARVGDDESLQSRPGKGGRDSRKEGRFRRNLVEEHAVEAVLFTLLADDGRDGSDGTGLAILAEDDVGSL